MTDTTTADGAAEAAAQTAGTDPAESTTPDLAAQTPAAESDVIPAQQPQVTLREFMVRLSLRDRRVELINAFNFSESMAGRFKDFESEFASRFTAFSQQVIED